MEEEPILQEPAVSESLPAEETTAITENTMGNVTNPYNLETFTGYADIHQGMVLVLILGVLLVNLVLGRSKL